MTQTGLKLTGVTVVFSDQPPLLPDIVFSLPPPADHADCHLHECHRYQRSGARWVEQTPRTRRRLSLKMSSLPPPKLLFGASHSATA